MTTELQIADATLDAWCEAPGIEAEPATLYPKPIRVSVQDVIVATGILERVEVRDLVGPMRFEDYAHPRQLAMYVARSITGQSYPNIGRAMGDRDHTTVLFAARKWFARVLFNEADRQRAVAVCRLATEIAEERSARMAAQVAWMRQSQANPALVDPSRQMVTA